MQSPQLHSQLFIAHWQVLVWLIVHPSAWRAYIKQIDPAVAPNFTLLNGWHSKALRQLFYIAIFVQPITVGLFIAGVFLFFRGYGFQCYVWGGILSRL